MDLQGIAAEDFYHRICTVNLRTHEDVFLKSTYDLSSATGMRMEDVDKCLDETAVYMFRDRIRTASNVKTWACLTTGCAELDKVLEGGIPINGITEIYGNSGGGKTQLCLQLALAVQLPHVYGGLSKGAIYICTEEVFPAGRLRQLIDHLQLKYPDNEDIADFDDKIIVEHIGDFSELKRFINQKLAGLVKGLPIGLIIIDSIAGCLRGENADADFIRRSWDLQQIASKLKHLSCKHNVTVIVTNQVADNLLTGEIEPTLGLAWSNVITSRFALHRNYSNAIRQFAVVFSPNIPQNECELLITSAGIVHKSQD